MAEKLGWRYADNLVIRLENTIPQVHLGKKERLRNLSGKFAVKTDALCVILEAKPRESQPNFVIFDDVYTTGATIAEIAKVLKKAGVKTVWGMSLARS